MVTLGNEPLRPFFGRSAKRLTAERHGEAREVELFDRRVTAIHLCHPRQAGRLGLSSPAWEKSHASWMKRVRSRRAG